MQQETIQSFTDKIYNDKIEMTVSDYIKEIQVRFYSDIRIDFMNDFLAICRRRGEFCVTQDILEKYGLVDQDPSHVKKFIERKNLKNGVHYVIRDIKSKNNNRTHKEYFLTPDGFKICLMRTIKTTEYCDYYVLLETAISYYDEYQKKMMKRELESKDKTIELKQNTVDLLIQKIDSHNSKLDDMSKQYRIDMDKMNNKLDRIINTTEEISSRSVPNVVHNINLNHEYSLLQNIDNKREFKLIRGEKKYINSKEKQFKHVYSSKIRNYSANPINFGIRLKKAILDYNDELDSLLTCSNDPEDVEFVNSIKIKLDNNFNFILGYNCDCEKFIEIITLIDQEKYNKLKELNLY
jgi:hypothetical protein